MDKSTQELLESKGFDVSGALHRFMNNEMLYIKCLKKFLDDDSFEQLKLAYESGNYNEAFKMAHTLKGLVSNLGINGIYELLVPVVEKLRMQNLDIGEELNRLEQLYKEAYDAIEYI